MSLYLILLTFFIVLAALSRVENRRLEQALIGVEHSFGGAGGRSRVSVIEPLDPSALPGSDVAALLSEELAALAVLPFASLSAERGEVRLAMPARLFFPPSGSELTGLGKRVLHSLAKVAARVEEPLRLGILLVRPASFWGLGPLPLDRAAALRAALHEAIAGADIGIVDAGGGDIVFRFRIVQEE
ncbi:MAG: hypothetical protein KIT81_02980 [Alphaproteobacteria bacterium]|nr:hypothetical protein [Alphaproteobacteria bacterium]